MNKWGWWVMPIHFQLGGELVPSGQKFCKKCKVVFPHSKKKKTQTTKQNYPLVFSFFTYVGKFKGKKPESNNNNETSNKQKNPHNLPNSVTGENDSAYFLFLTKISLYHCQPQIQLLMTALGSLFKFLNPLSDKNVLYCLLKACNNF